MRKEGGIKEKRVKWAIENVCFRRARGFSLEYNGVVLFRSFGKVRSVECVGAWSVGEGLVM